MVKYKSPSNNSKYYYSEKSIKEMLSIWNNIRKDKIITLNKSYHELYYELFEKMKPFCNKKIWLWCALFDKLINTNTDISSKKKKQYKIIIYSINKRDLKPEKPESWYKNPKEWLSNYDIQNVMKQYDANKKYNYIFLGVVPIDFATMNVFGNCIYSDICKINVKDIQNKGIKFLGLITNLDKHDQPGSHWTSTFFVIDPSLKTYGVYYYDSTGRSMPIYLQNFINDVKNQCEKINPNIPFNIVQNIKQQQRKNTECGMFSMIFQIRWINKHIVKKFDTSFEEIIGNPHIDDDNMLKLRNTLFRPNSKIELKKIKSL